MDASYPFRVDAAAFWLVAATALRLISAADQIRFVRASEKQWMHHCRGILVGVRQCALTAPRGLRPIAQG